MDEIQLIDAINATRISVMKIKYMALVDAYKRAYSENPDPADTYEFVQAAIDLASNDVCDILFPYSLVDKQRERNMEEAFKKKEIPKANFDYDASEDDPFDDFKEE